MSLLEKKWFYLGFITILIASYYVFYDSFLFQQWQSPSNQHWVSDVPNHSLYVLKFTIKDSFPAYSLWYKLVSLFSGFSKNLGIISLVSIIALSALIGIKYLINYWILEHESTNTTKVALFSFILIFVMPIASFYSHFQYPDITVVNPMHVYLGNISPNQWHNSTLILAMPVNIFLFYYSVRYLNADRFYPILIMGALTVLSILCKPNYALAFIPVLCLVLFVSNIKRQNYTQAFIKPILIVIPTALTLLYQWYFTFLHNSLFAHPTKTIFAPFLVWGTYSPHIVISFFLSIAFPFAVTLLYFKNIDRFVVLSWVTLIIATLMFALLAEYPYYVNGNYWWGTIAANYMLFLFSAKILINQPLDWKAGISYVILELHFLSGCFLLGSFFIKQTSLIL